jgi:uncharacterized membrane protein
VAELIAIAYPEAATGSKAEKEAQRFARDLGVPSDAIAAIARHQDGNYKVTSTHCPASGRPTYGMIWGPLFGLLYFVPVFEMTVGAGLATAMGTLERSGIDEEFQVSARDILQPGTSALFLFVENVAPPSVMEALLRKYGGTLLRTSLSAQAEMQLQQALHGTADRQPIGV